MLIPIAAAAIGTLIYLLRKKPDAPAIIVSALPGTDVPESVALTPFGDIPESARNGRSIRSDEEGASGSLYVVDSYAPDASGRTFHVAMLRTPGFPARVTPYTSFVSYWNDAENNESELYRAYSPEDLSGAVVSTMARDFGLLVEDAELVAA